MQKQIEKPIQEKIKNKKLESLKESFNKEVSNNIDTSIQPETREVVLRYASGCGCGGGENYLSRIVPYDSILQNGDKINNLEKADKQISKKEFQSVMGS